MNLVSEAERLEIKGITREAMRLAGGVETFAPVAGVGKATLSKYGSPSEPDAFIRADIMLAHARDTGAPTLIEHLARMAGYRLVPIEDAPGSTVGLGDLAQLSEAGGAVTSRLASALVDGVIDAAEKRDIREGIAAKIGTLHRLDRKLAGGA